MAWNRSTGEGEKPSTTTSRPKFIRGLIAALIVVAGSVAACFWFMPEIVKPDEKQLRTDSKIEEVTPAHSATNPANPSTSSTLASQGEQSPEVVTVGTNGAERAKGPKKPIHPFRIVRRNADRKQLFHTFADVCISRLVNSTPGNMMFCTFTYDGFAEKFKKALDTPIVIDPDDTPEEIEKKKAVIEARAELKERMAKGEDIEQVMREAEAESRRLANYREQLRRDLAKAMRERKFGADDMQDYVDAANKMLKDNGLQPLKYTQLWVNRIRREEAAIKAGK